VRSARLRHAVITMDEQSTCGKGLAEHSKLPATLARVMATTAAILEQHQKALVLEDENSLREQVAYAELAQKHHSLARELRATAAQMASYRDLPMGKHDMAAMSSSEAFETFRNFVAAEEELVAVVQRGLDRDRKMLENMRNMAG
jgi:hypothetical protein